MPRYPDPKSCDTLSIKARSEAEKKVICHLKQLSRQDDVEIIDLLMEGIDLLFRVHHWPPGNPQLTLETSLLPKKQFTPHCKCGRPAIKHGLHCSGVERDYCSKCFSEVLGRHDPKVWRFTTFDGEKMK